MTRVRVLHVHTLPVISGSGINTFLSMKGLDRRRWAPALMCAPGGPLIDLVRDHGMAVYCCPHLVQPLSPGRDVCALWALTRFLRRHRFEIVHTHNSKAGFIGRLAAVLARVPVIVHTVHGFAFHDREPLWRRWLFRNLERLAYHWCHRQIYISRPLMAWARAERIARPDKITLIYSGIELDRFQPWTAARVRHVRQAWRLPVDGPVIGLVAKLWEGKGHHDLLAAFARLRPMFPKACLVFVGEGPLEPSLRDRARRLGIGDAVRFTGFQTDVAAMTAMLDVAVLPSHFEGMGRVLLEAMALERPVVATRVGGIPDVVDHGRTGLLVPPGQPAALAAALAVILEDPALAQQMGRAGRARLQQVFSATHMAAAIEREYLRLLSTKGSGHDR